MALTDEDCPCKGKKETEISTQQKPEDRSRGAGRDCLLHKHVELSSNPQNLHERQDVV